LRKQYGSTVECDYVKAYDGVIEGLKAAAGKGQRVALMVSPMLSCEEAFVLAKVAKAVDPQAVFGVGPVPMHGQDKVFPPNDPKGFKMYAEKAPNARGVRRVLSAFGPVMSYEEMLAALGKGSGKSAIGAAIVTGNYPSAWATPELIGALGGKFVVLMDTLMSGLIERADIVLPGATWVEKSGTFENARSMLQAFNQAIPVIEMAKSEGQMALDLLAVLEGAPAVVEAAQAVVIESTRGQVASGTQVVLPRGKMFNAADIRAEMAKAKGLEALGNVSLPAEEGKMEADVEVVEL
jgi:anaerobic selenocysteine-containing dehydrogenase